MPVEVAARRAYVKDISIAVPEFDGTKIHLQRFITAIKLVNMTKGPYEEMPQRLLNQK